jgi:hypothetical protein
MRALADDREITATLGAPCVGRGGGLARLGSCAAVGAAAVELVGLDIVGLTFLVIRPWPPR